jgi:hypothetical protein
VETNFVTKQEQFLWIVQTCLLANAINVTSESEADRFRQEVSAIGMFHNADEARHRAHST